MATATASAIGGDGSTSTIAAEMATGSHVLRIDCYSGTKGLGVGEDIESSRFTVGRHSWYIIYYPDGYDEESAGWISLSLSLDQPTGDEDNIVKARSNFSLLDQNGKPIPEYTTISSMVYDFEASNDFEGGWGIDSSSKARSWSDPNISKTTALASDVMSLLSRASTKKPPSDLHRDLGRLLSEGHGADVTFTVRRKLFRAHRNVLAARSLVFKAELFGPMKEKTTARVPIRDMEPNVFKALLHFIYTDSLPEVGEGEEVMAQHLLVAADRYNRKSLKLLCEDKLGSNIVESTAVTTLVLAEQHGCHGLKEACFTFLLSPGNLKAVMVTDAYEGAIVPSFDKLVARLAPKCL